MDRRKLFEIGTTLWAVALVAIAFVWLTGGAVQAEEGEWLDCGDACASYCSLEGSECISVWDWFGCGCSVYCLDGSSNDVICM